MVIIIGMVNMVSITAMVSGTAMVMDMGRKVNKACFMD